MSSVGNNECTVIGYVAMLLMVGDVPSVSARPELIRMALSTVSVVEMHLRTRCMRFSTFISK